MPVVPPAEVAPGSDLYYALLYLPADTQRALTAVELACAAISGVVIECTDPGIARLRLAWWREELARLDARHPSHETTRALAAVLPGGAGDALRPVVDATERLLGASAALPADDFDALLSGFIDARWSLTIANSAAPAAPSQAALTISLELMRLREAALLLMDARRYLERGVVPVPVPPGAPPADVQALLSGSDWGTASLADQAAALHTRLQAALAARPRGVPLPVLVLARITAATLDEVLRDGCAVLSRRIALTPVRKLGIAWRSAVGRRLALTR